MLNYDAFCRYVRDAFAHLDDLAYLRGHPLSQLLAAKGRPLSGDAVRRTLLDAFERLKPPSAASSRSAVWRRYRYLRLRYLDGLSHDSISRDLGVSTRQARRDHLEALDAVGAVLWDTYVSSQSDPVVNSPATEAPLSTDGCESSRPYQYCYAILDALDTELSQTRLSAPGASADLTETITSVVDLASRLLVKRPSSIAVSLPVTLPPAAVDRTILRQILLSLLSYAMAACPTGRLSVAAEVSGCRGDSVVVRVVAEDASGSASSGAPVVASLAEAEALLAAGRHLADLHGVAVTLDAIIPALVTIETVIPAVRPATVLVVDDNPGVARLFQRYLHRTQFRLVTAGTWQRALRLAEELRPDIITLDVMMPSQDGWDILRRLKEREETRDIPVVVCSVLPEKPQALAFGASTFLAKPVTRESLLQALETCLPAHRAEHPARP